MELEGGHRDMWAADGIPINCFNGLMIIQAVRLVPIFNLIPWCLEYGVREAVSIATILIMEIVGLNDLKIFLQLIFAFMVPADRHACKTQTHTHTHTHASCPFVPLL